MKTKTTQERVLSSELAKWVGRDVRLRGWLHNKREMGGMTFVILRDRHGLVQVLDEKSEETKKLKGLQNGTVLTVFGTVVEDKRAPEGVEIHEPKIEVEVPVTEVSPVEVDKAHDHKAENLETLFENKVLYVRNPMERAIFRIQAGVGDAIREYLKSQDFTEFHSPKLLPGSTEGGAEVFKLDYFGREATLAQSAQFYKQMMVGAFERAFEFGGTYRAEPSMTTRHMTEFITVDVEMGFIESFQDIVDLLGNLLCFVTKRVWETHERELLMWDAKKPVLPKKLPEISCKDLHELFFKETGQDTRQEKDPIPAEERFITDYAAKKWQSEAVMVTEFPVTAMKFYHYVSDRDPTVTERADLMFRGVEIVTLTRREHRYDRLINQLKKAGGDPENPGFKYYLQAFKYGLPSHGGFGLGLERLAQKLIGLKSVKEATLFPRDTRRLTP